MNTLNPEIREWIRKYCHRRNFRIYGVDVSIEYKTKDGRIVDNRKFVYNNQSHRFNAINYTYYDDVTVAFNYIERVSHWKDY